MKSNDNFSVSLALKLTGDKSVLWIVQLSDILLSCVYVHRYGQLQNCYWRKTLFHEMSEWKSN